MGQPKTKTSEINSLGKRLEGGRHVCLKTKIRCFLRLSVGGYWLSAGRTAASSGSSIRQASAPVPDDRPRVPVGEAPQVSKWLRFRAIDLACQPSRVATCPLRVAFAGPFSNQLLPTPMTMPCGANILLEKCLYALLSCFLSIIDPLPSTLRSTRQPHLHCQQKHLLKRGSRKAGRNSLLDTDVEAFTSASSSTPLHH